MKSVLRIRRENAFIGLATFLTGSLLIYLGLKKDIFNCIALGLVLLIGGIVILLLIGLYSVSIEDDFLSINIPLLVNKRINVSDISKYQKILHYSGYEIATNIVVIKTNKRFFIFAETILDVKQIEDWLSSKGINAERIKPSILPGKGCDLPDIECEALCYRLELAKLTIQPCCIIVVSIIAISRICNNHIADLIIFIVATIWHIIMLYFRDLLFATGDKIVGGELPTANIWSKLCIRKDYKFIFLVTITNAVIWLLIIIPFFESVSIVKNNEYLIFTFLLLPAGWMRLRDADGLQFFLICVISAIIATACLPCFELSFSSIYCTSGIIQEVQNKEYGLSFSYEDNHYNVKTPLLYNSSEKEALTTGLIIYKSLSGGLYARILR